VQWGLRYLAQRQSRKPQATAEGDIDWAKQSVLMPVTSFLIGKRGFNTHNRIERGLVYIIYIL
jgi:hypothetical protein